MSAENSDFDHIVQDEEQRFSAAVRNFVESRARIEQTKGMLMLVYGIDADEAFGILRTQSQHHNVKLRVIAEQIRQDLSSCAWRTLRYVNPTRPTFCSLHTTASPLWPPD